MARLRQAFAEDSSLVEQDVRTARVTSALYLSLTIILALVASALMYAVGAMIAWIRRGFGARRPGVRVIEAEIEEP